LAPLVSRRVTSGYGRGRKNCVIQRVLLRPGVRRYTPAARLWPWRSGVQVPSLTPCKRPSRRTIRRAAVCFPLMLRLDQTSIERSRAGFLSPDPRKMVSRRDARSPCLSERRFWILASGEPHAPPQSPRWPGRRGLVLDTCVTWLTTDPGWAAPLGVARPEMRPAPARTSLRGRRL